MKELLAAKVKPDDVLVCYLGQTGFIFRTPDVSLTLTAIKAGKTKFVGPSPVNRADPEAFAEAIRESGCSSRVLILEPGKIHTFCGATL